MTVLRKSRTQDSSQKQELSPSQKCKLPSMNFMYCYPMEISKGKSLVTLYLNYNGLLLVFNFIYANLNQKQSQLMKLNLLYKAIEATLKLSSRMKSQEAIKEHHLICSSFINFLFSLFITLLNVHCVLLGIQVTTQLTVLSIRLLLFFYKDNPIQFGLILSLWAISL